MVVFCLGRLSKDVRTRDLEDVFGRYGKLARCELKYGKCKTFKQKKSADYWLEGIILFLGNIKNFAFVDFEDDRDAEVRIFKF